MDKNFASYITGIMLLFFLIAFLPSELSMIIGSAVFAIAAIGMPFGFLFGGAALCSLIFAFMTADFLTGIIMALAFIIPGWAEGFMIRKRCSLSGIISVTAILRSGFLLLCYDRMAGLERVTIREFIFGSGPEEFLSELTETGYPEELLEVATNMWNIMGDMLPSVIVISGLSFAFFSLVCTKFMTRRTPVVFYGIRKLSDIRMDLSFTVCAVVIGILAFSGLKMQVVFINCLYVIYVLYMASGFALLYRLIFKGIRRPAVSFIITLIMGVMSFGFLLPVMGIIGSFIKDKNNNSDSEEKPAEEKEENNENRKEDEI
ncbi:MAG: DUF2232 domain-containing protein [Clostridia bacterium]|nr:DUF2232 domain-containing protein [Clostridia bacterium]